MEGAEGAEGAGTPQRRLTSWERPSLARFTDPKGYIYGIY